MFLGVEKKNYRTKDLKRLQKGKFNELTRYYNVLLRKSFVDVVILD